MIDTLRALKIVGAGCRIRESVRPMLDVDGFMSDGYAKIEQAAPRGVADAARAALWQQLGMSPDDPAGWSEPVRWAADLTGQGPFGELVRSPELAQALDCVCGAEGWLPRGSLGNIPVSVPGCAAQRRPRLAHRLVHATGQPGDMYLVHPFTVHTADEHRGRTPRFMAQGPVQLTAPLTPASSSPLARVWENC